VKENYEVAVDPGSPERYFSEDLFFCLKAREMGYRIYCDLDLTFEIGHLGVQTITADRPAAPEQKVLSEAAD
jgi:hypothetical protein